MPEKKYPNKKLVKIGKMIEAKRKSLGTQYKSRENFIYNRSDEIFGSEDWISVRHLFNLEHGKNWLSIEKLIQLSYALEEDPKEFFGEILEIYKSSD